MLMTEFGAHSSGLVAIPPSCDQAYKCQILPLGYVDGRLLFYTRRNDGHIDTHAVVAQDVGTSAFCSGARAREGAVF